MVQIQHVYQNKSNFVAFFVLNLSLTDFKIDITMVLEWIDNLLVENNDQKMIQRIEILNKYKFNKNNAAQNILNDLRKELNK